MQYNLRTSSTTPQGYACKSKALIAFPNFFILFYFFYSFLFNCLFLHLDLMDRLRSPEPGTTCSKLTIETLEKGVKYAQS